MIKLALDIAVKEHLDQTRDIGGIKVPCVVHPVAVMNLLIQHGEKGRAVLAAALLHDAVEDSKDRENTRHTIKSGLGARVLGIVDELTLPLEAITKSRSPMDKDRRTVKYAHIGETMTNGSMDARKVKLADRICNVRDFISSGERSYAERYGEMFLKVCPSTFTGDSIYDSLHWTLVQEVRFGQGLG